MFPIRDEIPSRRAPVVTWAILAVNLAVFAWQWTLPEAGVRRLFYLFGLVPARLADPAWAAAAGLPPGGLLSLVTSMFLHGGLLHLVSNLWSLWIFGDNVEDRMGRLRFPLFYLVCGLAAGGVHWISDPASVIPTVGASGAIAGVLGAYLRWYPGAKVLTLVPIVIYPLFVDLPAVVFLGLWFLSQLASGTMSLGAGAAAGGVAWWAHVGGFVAGFLLANRFARRGPEQLPPPARHYVLPHTRSRAYRSLPPADWP